MTNFSGTNLNVGIYDNDLKGVGQDARSHLRQFRVMNGINSGCPFQTANRLVNNK